MCKSIKSIDRIIIFVILLIIIIPIFIHQIKLFNDRRIKQVVSQISEMVGKGNNNEIVKYEIDAEFLRKNEITMIKGNGIAFVDTDNSVTVIFSYKDKCAIKFSFDEKVYLQDKKCDEYELLKGMKVQIVNNGDGLYKINKDTYRYQGYNVNNYLKYGNRLWRIMEINNNSIKIVSEEAITSMKLKNSEFLKSDVYNYLKNNLYNSINKEIKLLSINDIISASLEGCKVGNYINCPNKSYLIGNSTWIMDPNGEDGWYLYTDGNIYPDNVNSEHDVRAVVYLNEDIKVLRGNGTLSSPYIINETILGE